MVAFCRSDGHSQGQAIKRHDTRGRVALPRGILTLKLHRHGGWLFDSELSVCLATGGVSSGAVTVGWLDDGRMMVRSDLRKGSHGMHYMKQRWFGYSILVRAAECPVGDVGVCSC